MQVEIIITMQVVTPIIMLVMVKEIAQRTGMIFIWSNIYYGELFCGGTSYAPGVLKVQILIKI